MHWSSFAFQPETEGQITPNYFGLGLNGAVGYSLKQALDVALFFNYTPAVNGHVDIGKEKARLYQYGGQIALRIQDQIFFGVKFGTGQYQLFTKVDPDLEVSGKWEGQSYAATIGSIYKADKKNYWQLSLEFGHMIIGKIDLALGEKWPERRKIDQFILSAGYTFNGSLKKLFKRGLFR